MVRGEPVMVCVIADRVNGLFGVTDINLGVVREPQKRLTRYAAVGLKGRRDARSRVREKPLERADFEKRREANLLQRAVKNRLFASFAERLRRLGVERGNAVAQACATQNHLKKLPVRLTLVGVEPEFFKQIVLHALNAARGRDRIKEPEILPRREVRLGDRFKKCIVGRSVHATREKVTNLGSLQEHFDLRSVSGFDDAA